MTTTTVPPADLLGAARAILARAEAQRGQSWARAVALLARQALEGSVDSYWAQRAPGMDGCRRKVKLLCLASYLDEPMIGRLAYQTWAALSDACHHHAYELAPTTTELAGWIETVGTVVDSLTRNAARPV